MVVAAAGTSLSSRKMEERRTRGWLKEGRSSSLRREEASLSLLISLVPLVADVELAIR